VKPTSTPARSPSLVQEFFSVAQEIESSTRIDDQLATKLKSSSAGMYNQLAATAPRFWNWGFHRDDVQAELQKRLPDYAFETDGFSELLYYYMLRQVPASDHSALTLVEVGSGAGNGLNLVSRVFGFKAWTGVDLSENAVRAANARFARPGLRYLQGDAENLPFGDGEVDVVLNVESSHCYPSPLRFLNEVTRILKPGGYFAHADAFTKERWDLFERAKRENGAFEWLEKVDISPYVREAIARRMSPDSLIRKQIRMRKPSWRTSALQRKVLPILAHEVLLLRAYGSQFVGYELGVREKLVNVLLEDKVKAYHRRIEAYLYHLGRKM
jgi:ubiquinone/menaquinone biosynthesis C-methylase UbiE